MTTSAIPHAITALHELLEGVQWPDRDSGAGGDVSVSLATELRDVGREQVMLGQARGGQEWSALGAQSKAEDFSIDLYVAVRWPGDSGIESLRRAWQLFAVIEELLASSDYIDLARDAGVQWAAIDRPYGTPITDNEGAAYVVSALVRFRARIHPRES